MSYKYTIKPVFYRIIDEITAGWDKETRQMPLDRETLGAGLRSFAEQRSSSAYNLLIVPQQALEDSSTTLLRESFLHQQVLTALPIPMEVGNMEVLTEDGSTSAQLALLVAKPSDAPIYSGKNRLISTLVYEDGAFRNRLLQQEFVRQELAEGYQGFKDSLIAALKEQGLEVAPQAEPVENYLDEIRDFCREHNGEQFRHEHQQLTLNYDEGTDSVAFVYEGKEDNARFADIEESVPVLQELQELGPVSDAGMLDEMGDFPTARELQEMNFGSSLTQENYFDLLGISDDFGTSTATGWEPQVPVYCQIQDEWENYYGLAKLVSVEHQSFNDEDELVIHLVDPKNQPHIINDAEDVLFTQTDYERFQQSLQARIVSQPVADKGITLDPQLNEIQQWLPHEMVEQYEMLRQKHPEALLLFRIGDQYECYHENAQTLCEVMGYKLETHLVEGRNTRVPFTSFATNDLDTVLPKLIRAGQRVAICDAPEGVEQRMRAQESTPNAPFPEVEDNAPTYNLYTNVHGDHDHDWEDYLDFTPGKPLRFSSYDYTYAPTEDRSKVLPMEQMSEQELAEAREALTEYITADERVVTPQMWIGSREPRDFQMKCLVGGSKKYNGEAQLVTIGTKKDRFNREVYYAKIRTPEGKLYQVSPKCVHPDTAFVEQVLQRMETKELAIMVDELRHGHWNFPGYNRHLFRWPEQLDHYGPLVYAANQQEIGQTIPQASQASELDPQVEPSLEQSDVALRRWQDDIALYGATYKGGDMEIYASATGHVFYRDKEDKALLCHDYYYRKPKELLTNPEVASALRMRGVTDKQMMGFILEPTKDADCYALLRENEITKGRMSRGIHVVGEEAQTDIAEARHLWSKDAVAAGATHQFYDSDLTNNEMFIAPDGNVFVYYPDAKDNYWEDEIYSHYKFPDLRGKSNEDIVQTLNSFHDERSIYRPYDVMDIARFRSEDLNWTCSLLEDVMMSTDIDKIEQTYYLPIVRQLEQMKEYTLVEKPSDELLEVDYSINNQKGSLMQDYKRQNAVELTGFVVSPPEFKTLPNSGLEVMSFNLSLRTGDSRQTGADGKPEVKSLLVRVEKFLKEGDRERLAPICEKGHMVSLNGYIAGQEKYETKAGARVNSLRLTVNDVQPYTKAAEGAPSNYRNSVTISGRLTKDVAWVGKDESKLNASLAYFSAKEGEQDARFFLSMSKFMKPEQKAELMPLLTPNAAVKVEGWLEAVEFTNKEGTQVNTFNFVPKTIEKAELKEQTADGQQEKPAIVVDRQALANQYAGAFEAMRQEGVDPDKLSDAQLNRVFEERKSTDLTTATGARKSFQLQKGVGGYNLKATAVVAKAAQHEAAPEM